MRRHAYTISVTLALFVLGTPLRAESVSVLLEKGIYQEETAGNLDTAIHIYSQIVEREKVNRPVVAQALARLGECQLKRGQLKEAAQAFDDLRARFPDQTDLIARTQRKLAASRANMSETQVGQLVRAAVMSISTRPEGDPEVNRAIASLQGINEPILLKALIGHLNSDEANVRRSAIYVLWKGGFDAISPAVEPLNSLCSHPEEFTRGMAALALGANKIAPSFQLLVNMTTSDKSGYARRCAAYALGLLGNPEGKDTLEKALKDNDPLVASNAQAALSMLAQSGPGSRTSQSSARPHVIRTNPKTLVDDVDPALNKITVTFDRMMMEKSWSWTGGGETLPTKTGEPYYDAQRSTCTLPVKLEPGKVYFVGVNGPRFHYFQTNAHVAAIPYAIVFSTRSTDGKSTPIPGELAEEAKRINAEAEPERASQESASIDLVARNKADAKARTLLDAETRRQVADFDRQFTPLFKLDPGYVAASSAQQRDTIIERWMLEVQGDDFDLRTRAIASLGNVRAQKAVPLLLSLAQEDMKNNRPRWLAVRGLGRIGDPGAVPVLIELIDHGNANVRVYSRLALAQITGIYLGTDKEQWRQWWKTHRDTATTQPESWIDEQGRLVDRTDYPFVDDPEAIGNWKSVDFVKDPEEFKIGEPQWKGQLYLKNLSLLAQGRVSSGPWRWTSGRLIHPGDRTASRYIIKSIDGAMYLFLEWKSGDYSLRHQPPRWYVLKKS